MLGDVKIVVDFFIEMTYATRMKITVSDNGNLRISLDVLDVEAVHNIQEPHTIAAEGTFIREFLAPLGYNEILPEQCGALTSAPLITDGKNVWGFMDYQIKSFIEELLDGNETVWQKG